MATSANPPRATILVIDDNDANCALAQSTLDDEGYRVVLATSGALGLEAFRRELPDCVLLDVRMPGLDGFEVCTQIRALPHGLGIPILFLTALRDVDTFDRALAVGGDDFLTKPVRPTELLVRVESALKLRRMSTELGEHYALLKQQRDDLLRVQLQKERLMAFVVHDLKNPVNSMDLHAQVLLRSEVSDEARECATQIRTDARHLTRMIMNLLDLSKGDEGKLSPKRTDIDLTTLVRDVLGELELTARSHKVRFESAIGSGGLRADHDLIRRTLANLVENAIRHAPAQTSISVDARSDGDSVEIRVADRGSGVLPDMRSKIFDPFVQLGGGSDRPESRAGRGLGLAFCKLAVEVHGGRIWIEDAAPGAVFCVRLPHDA